MNAEQAGQVIEYVAAGFRTEVSPQTAAVWIDHLRGVSIDVGMESARLAVAAGGSWMPTAGEFLATCRQVARRTTDTTRQLPESTTPPTRAEAALGRIAELRGVLAAAAPPMVARRTPDPDRPRESAPLPFCSNDDHSRCGADGPPPPRKDPPPS